MGEDVVDGRVFDKKKAGGYGECSGSIGWVI